MTCSTPALTVHILLATYNGARFIKEQLESIARQTHAAWTLTVSDDGSTDDTLAIVSQFAKQVSRPVTILHGPQRGSTHNFFHLIQHAQTDNPQDLYAFCDQDDVWLDEKLARAVLWHHSQPNHAVRLYCGRTQFVNELLKPIGLSPGIHRPPSFGNALVQNIASGNTMVMSHSVLMAQKQVQAVHSVWHDWTTYLVATAMGGLVWFDNEPSLLYRQHVANVIGANEGFKAQVNRLKPLFEGRFKQWSDLTILANKDIQDRLTQQAKQCLDDFRSIRLDRRWHQRIRLFSNSEVRRQTWQSNCTLLIAVAFRFI
jgi:glycosyltransferase involved in cell wall biosynthesis